VTTTLFAAVLGVLEVIRPAFTPQTFAKLVVILVGWIRTHGRHAITEALVVTGLSGLRDHSAFHRVFSTAPWDPDEVGRRLFLFLLRWVDGAVPLVIDDTLAPHKGPEIFGLGCHLDAVRSTRRTKVFCFGHNWVVLSVVVRLPFTPRPWALPVLFRLYRTHGDCDTAGDVHRKKTELAREMLTAVRGWVPDRTLDLAIDQAYCNRTVLHDRPPRLVVFGSLRLDAALTAPSTEPRRRKGPRLPTPADLAADPTVPWSHTRVVRYGRRRTIAYKTCVAQWYHSLGPTPVRVVVVRCTTGDRPLRAYFCTDATASVPATLRGYGDRWPTEPTFRDSKQLLGLAETSARSPAAVRRTAPMIGLLYTILVVWFQVCRLGDVPDLLPNRPWNPTKKGASFADILRVAHDHFSRIDLPAKLPQIENFARRGRRPSSGEQLRFSFAA
jgi:hypothetical protein